MLLRYASLVLTLFLLVASISAATDQPLDTPPDWAIGMQGNFPLWGGLSVKYMGLGKLHLQLIEHYVQDSNEYSGMVAFQAPVTLVDYGWSRVYIAPGIGFRKKSEDQMHYINTLIRPEQGEYDPGMEVMREVTETTLGGGLLFGVELFLDNLFGSDGARYGVNVEFGQGVGQVKRDAVCSGIDDDPVDCDVVYDQNPWLREESSEEEGTSTQASFVVGFGFHIYF